MAKLPRGKYVILEHEDSYIRGGMIDSMRLKREILDGIYPDGTILQHILSGLIFRIDITPKLYPFGVLSKVQQVRAERYRLQSWPYPQDPPRPRQVR